MVVFDSTVLLLLLNPAAYPPTDPQTGKPLEHAKARIDFLVQNLTKSKDRILIPTPVLAEVLVGAGPSKLPKLVEQIEKSAAFKIAAFDQLAAVELALLQDSPKHKQKSSLTVVETKAKLKFDRQIIAIAKANGVRVIYSDDEGVHSVAAHNNIKVIRSFELDLPPAAAQKDMFGGGSAGAVE
jgi:predicted nucleic acid-binding protein